MRWLDGIINSMDMSLIKLGEISKLITWITALSWSRGLHDLVKLCAMPCGATQDMATGEGDGKLLQYSCLENLMSSMKRQKDMTLKDELDRLVGAQYATGEEGRSNSRKSEETEPKRNRPDVDVTGDGSQV